MNDTNKALILQLHDKLFQAGFEIHIDTLYNTVELLLEEQLEDSIACLNREVKPPRHSLLHKILSNQRGISKRENTCNYCSEKIEDGHYCNYG